MFSIYDTNTEWFEWLNERPRPLKSSYQIKQEPVNFLLECIERNLEEYKKDIEIRDK